MAEVVQAPAASNDPGWAERLAGIEAGCDPSGVGESRHDH
jgi:hypothetical protein